MSKKEVFIGPYPVGEGHPTFIVGEIGINHNGDIEIAKKLIDMAKIAGCNAVKFQKRVPESCVPPSYRNVIKETPWGLLTYLEYRKKIEFGEKEYSIIDKYCKEKNIIWFASVWDCDSVDFIAQFNTPCYKIPSACLTNKKLLEYVKKKNLPIILSTGMSTLDEIKEAVNILEGCDLILLQCTSTYPAKPEELNLRVIQTYKKMFNCVVGYSGHEVGLQTTYAAVALGASYIERHITLDRSMWGTDQAASVERAGLVRLVRDIRVIEKALGDGIKKVYESELPIKEKLRWVNEN